MRPTQWCNGGFLMAILTIVTTICSLSHNVVGPDWGAPSMCSKWPIINRTDKAESIERTETIKFCWGWTWDLSWTRRQSVGPNAASYQLIFAWEFHLKPSFKRLVWISSDEINIGSVSKLDLQEIPITKVVILISGILFLQRTKSSPLSLQTSTISRVLDRLSYATGSVMLLSGRCSHLH